MLSFFRTRFLHLRPLGWCTRMSKPGLGTLHLHSKVWNPRGVDSIWYVQPDNTTAHEVPAERFRELSFARSPLEAMAILRRADDAPTG